MDDDNAMKLIEKSKGQVQAIAPPSEKTAGWVDPQDPRIRDGFQALDKWLDAIRPALSERHPRYREAMQEFDRMDSCWIAGDLLGFRRAIETIRAIGELKQSDMLGGAVGPGSEKQC